MEWFDGLDREQVKEIIHFAASSLDKAPVYAESQSSSLACNNGQNCVRISK